MSLRLKRANHHALDKKTGRVIWKHDLWGEYKGHFDDRGYSPSPISYKKTIILPVPIIFQRAHFRKISEK
jgi:hypothetical protein